MRAFQILPVLLVLAICAGPLPEVAAQTAGNRSKAANDCPKHPSTIRAMHNCYRPLLVFAPSMDDPQLSEQLQNLEPHSEEMQHRALLYVPIVPEGHNQPVPRSKFPTASLSEDELAAARHRFKVETNDFLVILLGKDGAAKITSKTPVSAEQLKSVIDSMPGREQELRQSPEGGE